MKTILAAALTLAAVSCEQHSSEPAPEKKPATAEEPTVPEERPAPNPAPEKPAAPDDPTETSSYIGMTVQDASARADKADIRWRVVEEDGQSRPVTMDYRPDRLNFVVEKGKIIRVTKG
jgi:hypothetical protein